MALTINQIAEKVAALRVRHAERDNRRNEVLAVRNGNMVLIRPDFFPEDMDKAMIANFIDVAARDLAEVIAPLPSINCSGVNVADEKQRNFHDNRTQIAMHYIESSDFATQNYVGADWYNTYGSYIITVEPDAETNGPRLRIENPLNTYPEYDRFGRLVSFSRRFKKTHRELLLEFPELRPQIIRACNIDENNMDNPVSVIRYEDKHQITLFTENSEMVLSSIANPMGKLRVRIGNRPHVDPENPRGQFDDIIWVQLARARFSFLAMEAAEKSVQAPIAVPNDISEFPLGSDTIIRSANPQGIRRVGLELPQGAFIEQQALETEMRLGARYPEGRSGNIDASIITGQGVQALLGGFDSQVKAAQQIMSRVIEEAVALCFEMDEVLFNDKKIITGISSGTPYKLTYTPKSAIKGDYSVQVRYGLMAGLDPNRALIFSLQAMGAKLISRDMVMRELPFEMNVTEEQKRIEVESMLDALTAAFMSMAGAIPQMIQGGADPTQLVTQISEVIDARKRNIPIEDAIREVFAPEPAPPQTAPAGMESPVAEGAMSPSPEQMMRPPAGANPMQGQMPPQGGGGEQVPPEIAGILAQLGGQV
jgi:hypothetical protein